MTTTRKSSAPGNGKGRGQRIYDWLMRRVTRDKGKLARLLYSKLPARWNEGECIPWLGPKNPESGYPVLSVWSAKDKRTITFYAHHIFWTLANQRPIPDEFELGHSCDNRICVNPAHLSLMVRGPNLHQRNARHKWTNNQCPF